MDLKQDPITGELVLENGDLAVVRDSDATAQFLRQRLRLIQTEWFLDENEGIPYFDDVLVKNPQQVTIDAIFKREILSVNGILELLTYAAVLDGPSRTMTLTFQARTADGVIDFSETIEV